MNNKQETDWINKEKRELFCKYVNSTIMTKKEVDLDVLLKEAKKVVDEAFNCYPDRSEEERPF